MKVVIAGSRGLQNREAEIRGRIASILSTLKIKPTEIVSGKAIGPDQTGETFARMFSIPIKEMPADWTTHGKAAGPIRNRKMAEYGDMGIVFWDGESPGSLNMIKELSRVKKLCIVEIL